MESKLPKGSWKVRPGAAPGFYLVTSRSGGEVRRYCAFTSAGQWKVCSPSGGDAGDAAGEIIQAAQSFAARHQQSTL